MANELATAYIQLLPSATGLREAIAKEFTAASAGAKGAGSKAGAEFSKGFDSKGSKLSSDAFGDMGSGAKQAGTKAGQEYGSAFGQTKLVQPDITSNASFSTALDSQVAEVKSSAERLGLVASKSVEDGFRTAELDLDGAFVGLNDSGVKAGEEAGSNIGSGVVSGLAEAGVEIAGEFAELGVEAAGRGAEIGAGAAGGVTSGLVSGLAESAASMQTSFSSALAGLPVPALAVGTAAGALVVKGFSDAIANDAGIDALSARLGASGKESAQFAKVSATIYREAWGDSTAEVNTAIDAVYSTLEESRGGEQALQNLTRKAVIFSKVMGQDVGKSVLNAGILIDTGLAKNADEAFDLMTAGLQRVPAAVRDELGDATEEYSQFFAGLGKTGAEAMGILVGVAGGGTYAIDKTGDALKEFRIRATDMSVGTVAAYDAIGLSASEMTAELLAGGDRAGTAFDSIINGILAIEDPTKRQQVALAFMGTQFEDIAGDGDKLAAVLTGLVAPGMENVAGAADGLASSGDNAQTAIATVRRELQGLFEDAANKQLDPLSLLISDKDKSILDYGSALGKTIGNGLIDGIKLTVLGPLSLLLSNLPNPIPDLLPDGFFGETDGSAELGDLEGLKAAADASKAAAAAAGPAAVATSNFSAEMDELDTRARLASLGIDAASSAADAYKSSIEAASSADDLLGAGLASGAAMRDLRVGLGQQTGEAERQDQARKAAAEMDRAANEARKLAEEEAKAATSTERLNEALGRLHPELRAAEIELGAAESAANAFSTAIENSTSLDDLVESSLNVGEAFSDFSKSMRRLPDEIDLVGASLGKYKPRQRAAIQAMLELGKASTDYLASLIKQGKESSFVRAEADRLRAEFVAQMRAAGKTEEQINSYLETMGLLPSQVETGIKLAGVEEAKFRLEAYTQLLDGKIPTEVASEVIAQIDLGNLDAAAEILKNFAKTNPVDLEIDSGPIRDMSRDITTATDALEEQNRVTLEIPKGLDYAKAALGGYTEAQERGLQAVLDGGDAAQEFLASLIGTGQYDKAIDLGADLAQSYRDIFAAQGLSTDEQNELLFAMGLMPEQITTAVQLSGIDESMFKLTTLRDILKNEDGTSGIPAQIDTFIGTKIAEGDFKTAADLLSAFQIDMQDGVLNNPILLGIAADTDPAKAGVQAAKEEIAASPPTDIPLGVTTVAADEEMYVWRETEKGIQTLVPVGANTYPADTNMFVWRVDQQGNRTLVPVDANTGLASVAANDWRRDEEGKPLTIGIVLQVTNQKAIEAIIGGPLAGDQRGIGAAELRAGRDMNGNGVIGRAVGGKVWPGQPFLVGEHGPELGFFPESGGMLTAGQTQQALAGTKVPRVEMPAPSTSNRPPVDIGGITYQQVKRAPTPRDIVRGVDKELFLATGERFGR